jgi:hypothetical protein
MYKPVEVSAAPVRKVSIPELRARKHEGPPIAMVTAYDYTMARLMDEGGADVVLVGDSLGMVIQGQSSTIPVTLDEICYHGRAVARGLARAHLVGDMPFLAASVSEKKAVKAAGKLMQKGCFEAVKIEGGEDLAPTIRRIVDAGIPVMGHVGLMPQRVHALGGFKVQGKRSDEADQIISDAQALEEAGSGDGGDRHPDHRHRRRAVVRRAGAGLLRLPGHVPGDAPEVRQALRRGGRRHRRRDAALRGRDAEPQLPAGRALVRRRRQAPGPVAREQRAGAGLDALTRRPGGLASVGSARPRPPGRPRAARGGGLPPARHGS